MENRAASFDALGRTTRRDQIDQNAQKSLLLKMAEGEGFEPPEACASTVFKTAAFDRSAIPPGKSTVHHSPCDSWHCTACSPCYSSGKAGQWKRSCWLSIAALRLETCLKPLYRWRLRATITAYDFFRSRHPAIRGHLALTHDGMGHPAPGDHAVDVAPYCADVLDDELAGHAVGLR